MAIIPFSELRENLDIFKFIKTIVYLSVCSLILFSSKLYFAIDFVWIYKKVFIRAVNFGHDIMSSSINIGTFSESISLFIFFLLKKENLFLVEYILVH